MITIEELFKQSIPVWSWSKLGKFTQCPKSYFYSYIAKMEKHDQSGYGKFGGLVHDCSEQLQKGEWTHEQALEHYDTTMQGYLDRGLTIAFGDINVYRANNRHFIQNFRPVENARTEVQVLAEVEGRWFVGYIDLLAVEKVEKDENGNEIFHMVVGDYKTSKIYSGEKYKHNAMQLILYAHMLELLYPNIRVSTLYWNHVMFASVSFNGGASARKLRSALYIDYVKRMEAYAKKQEWDMPTSYIMEYVVKNEVPPEFEGMFTIEDCLVEITYNASEVERLKKYIRTTCGVIDKTNDFICKKDNIFCTALCEFYWACEAYNETTGLQTKEIFKDINIDLAKLF